MRNTTDKNWSFTIIVILIMILMILASAWYHDAFAGDTTLVDVGTYDVNLGNGKHVMVIGDARIYRKNGVLKLGKWESKAEQSGIYEHVIKERQTTRASEDAPTYKVTADNGEDYVSFTFEGGVVAADSFKFRSTKDGWIWKNNDGKYDVEVVVSNDKVKETITTKKETKFKWLVDANKMPYPQPDGSINIGALKIEKATAVDKNGDSVATTVQFTWDNGWWYKLNVDTAGAMFPITVDPTISDSSVGVNAGTIEKSDAVFLTARNSATGDAIETNPGYGGTQTTAVFRFFSKFYYNLPAGIIVDSAYYRFRKQGGTIDTASSFLIGPAQHTELATSQYIKFIGRAASGAYTGFKTLGRILSSSIGGTAFYSIKLNINSATDTIKTHDADTLRLVMINTIDSLGSVTPTAWSLLAISTDSPNQPRLYIWYSNYSLSCSLSVGSRYDTLIVSTFGSDTANIDSLRMFKREGTDSIKIGTTKTTFFGNKIGGLLPNTKYIIFTRNYYTSPADSVRSNLDTIYTRPDTGTFLFTGLTSTSISIDPKAGPLNPALTKISVHDSSASDEYNKRLYLTLTGDTSATERFYTSPTWGTVTVTGFTRGQWGIFGVRAQNDDSTYKSGWEYDSLQIPVGFDSVAFTGIDTNKIRVMFDSDTFATGKRLRPFVYVGTDTTWGDSINFISTVHRDTITVDSLNRKYYAKVRLTDSSNVWYYSTVDSARTYAVKVSSVTLSWVRDTVFVLTITKHGKMPLNSGYFVIDSARVTADCTKVYMHPDSLGYILSRKIGSVAALSDTYKVRRGQWTPGVTPIKIRVHAINLDSLGNP